ncbi:MAG: hypothetical protein ACI8W8_003062 [Rhodothermales bacterium]|jgi:hypothetical protein
MRSVELLVVLRLVSWRKSKWTYAELAQSLYLGEGQTHGAVKGAAQSGFFDLDQKTILYGNLMEFIEHGVKYAFAAQATGEVVGVRTGPDAEPMRSQFAAGSGLPFVWDAPDLGQITGVALPPLHRVVPRVAIDDHRFHELLALIDVLRLRQSARHMNLALRLLKERLRA